MTVVNYTHFTILMLRRKFAQRDGVFESDIGNKINFVSDIFLRIIELILNFLICI